jgi:antitoxin (DNA-binding transcriptional repressor) of toxin-antitoxin stability system
MTQNAKRLAACVMDSAFASPARLFVAIAPFFGIDLTSGPCGVVPLCGAHLDTLIEHLVPGEEILITDRGRPLAQVKKSERSSWPCKAGSYRKAEFWMAPDFDAPLDDFKEYME